MDWDLIIVILIIVIAIIVAIGIKVALALLAKKGIKHISKKYKVKKEK